MELDTATMAATMEKLKENCMWVPVTPDKTVGGSPLFQNVSEDEKNYCLSEIRGQGKEGGRVARVSRSLNNVNNCDGSVFDSGWPVDGTKIAENYTGSMSCKEDAGVENLELESKLHEPFKFGLDSEKASKTPESKASEKRRQRDNDLNEKPQRKLRMKVKKHRPKIFDEMKLKKPVTPKVVAPQRPMCSPLTPKTRTPRKAKCMKTDPLNLQVDASEEFYHEAPGNCDKHSCRKRLDFNTEVCTLDQNSKVCQETEVEEKEESAVGSHDRFSSLIVYQRKFRPNYCLLKSRRLGPTFPKICKKSRMKRRRAIVSTKFVLEDKKKTLQDHQSECLECSRKIGPNFPMKCKKALMKRQRATVFDKFGGFVKMIPSTRQQRRPGKSGTTSLYPIAKLGKEFGSTRTRKSLTSSTLNSSSLVHLTRKRSKITSTCRPDFRSFIYEMSKLQFSDAFLRNASTIRSQVTASNQIAAGSEVEYISTQNSTTEEVLEIMELPQDNVFTYDKSTQNLTTEEVIELMELPQDNVFTYDKSTQNLTTEEVIELMDFSLDNVFSCNENSRKSASESSDLMLTSKTDFTGVRLDPGILNYLNSHCQNVASNAMKERGLHFNMPPLHQAHLNIARSNFHEQINGLSHPDDAVMEAMFDFVTQRMELLHIDDRNNQLAVRNLNASGPLVPSSRKNNGPKMKKPLPKVDLDPESLRAWNRLMENGGTGSTEPEKDENPKYWDDQRKLFGGRVRSFIACMNHIQGNKKFTPWKGSVVDSAVGVFLTQNVSDHLSSSAYLSLAAKFPSPPAPEHMADETSKDDIIPGSPLLRLDETSSGKSKETPTTEKAPLSSHGGEVKVDSEDQSKPPADPEPMPRRQKGKGKGKQEKMIDGGELRRKYSRGISKNIPADARDTINWEAVRQKPEELAKVIMPRGMGFQLAGKIKMFLDRMVREHGTIDLEWLREVPPEEAKEYLLNIYGLGLKSVECLRLLTLHHHAFPIDTNVGRILIRLGWVPLQPLPGDLKLHLLEQYPDFDAIQKYVWPRMCRMDQPTLYECHYQMITFAKAFCTKRQPNCNACPMRLECRHFASAYASSTPSLHGPGEKATDQSGQGQSPYQEAPPVVNLAESCPGEKSTDQSGQEQSTYQEAPPVVNLEESCFPEADFCTSCEPIIEIPASPGPQPVETIERDIEDFGCYSDDEMPSIKLNTEEFKRNLQSLISCKDDLSKALVAPEVAYIPMRTKYPGRLKTLHEVYEIPDSHRLLEGFDEREPGDPCPYLLAVWRGENNMNSSQEPSTACSCPDKTACGMFGCYSRQIVQYQNDQIVRGTILVPCRTANRGRFPLNGTYFQVNEVFADHESSQDPIHVPRDWIHNFRKRLLFCGASITSICRGFTMEQIGYCFRNGFICVREMDRRTRAPRRLAMRFHLYKTSKREAEGEQNKPNQTKNTL